MGLFSLIRRWLFDEQHATGSASPQTATAEVSPSRREVAWQGTLALRDEIIDAHTCLCGFRFRLDSPADDRTRGFDLVNDLSVQAITALARRRIVLLPLRSWEWQSRNFRQFIVPNVIFFLLPPESGEHGQEWLRIFNEMRDSGGLLAVSAKLPESVRGHAWSYAKYAIVDMQEGSLADFEQQVLQLRNAYPTLMLIADNVQSWAEHRLCLSLGIEYCMGGFVKTADADDKSPRLNQSRVVLIEMLNMLRQDCALSDLSEVAKRDPGIALRVLTMANSSLYGLSTPVASLEQAIVVLGRETLYRSLTISLFQAGAGQARDAVMLELSLQRARLLELLALASGKRKQEADELFLVGIMSLMDSLLSLTMDKLLEKMHLPVNVADVLLSSAGPYGSYLMLALTVERGRSEQLSRLGGPLGLTPAIIEECNLDAMAWAESAVNPGI